MEPAASSDRGPPQRTSQRTLKAGTQPAGRVLSGPWAPEDGVGLSHLTLPTAQGPRTEPGLDFTDRNGGSPSTPTLHWAGSLAGLAYLGWGGRGWTPQEHYNTGSVRGRCWAIKHR